MQRGEHIKKAKGSVRLKGDSAQRGVKKISKRDAGADYDEDEYYSDEEYEYDYEEESDYDQEAEEEYYYDNDDDTEGFPFGLLEEDKDGGGVISFNDIETECPAATICVERFFCAEFSGNSVSDQIVKIQTMNWVWSILSTVTMVMFVFLVRSSEPPTPPSQSAKMGQEKIPYLTRSNSQDTNSKAKQNLNVLYRKTYQ